MDLSGKKIVHTTSAGTQGIVNAVHAEEILTGSLVNARAVADYISGRQPETVSLVAMGNGGERTAREDVICARYIKCLLEGRTCLIDEEIRSLRTDGGEHFFRPQTQEIFPQEDFRLCTRRDIFPFVLRVEKRENGGLESVKIDVQE